MEEGGGVHKMGQATEHAIHTLAHAHTHREYDGSWRGIRKRDEERGRHEEQTQPEKDEGEDKGNSTLGKASFIKNFCGPFTESRF